jgi:hypothetical protein
MAAPRKVRAKSGGARAAGTIQTPVNTQDLTAAVEQLQASLNELTVRYNAHADAAHAGANKVTGAAQTAADLFVAAPTS